MATVYCCQHLDAEPPALIADVLGEQGLAVRVWRADRGELPERVPADCVGLVVMGGPMGVYDAAQYTWMIHELGLIRDTLRARRPVLGVCLGAQLVAAAAGASIYPGRAGKEIGWGAVSLTAAGREDPLCRALPDAPDSEQAMVFHWHGDTYELPPGAQRLAGSARYPQQAFRIGRHAYGFQFHFEVSAAIIDDWVARWRDDLDAAGLAPEPIVEGIPRHLGPLQARGRALVTGFAGHLRSAAAALQLAGTG